MGFEAHVPQGLGTFQPQQATAHHHAHFGAGPGGFHALQVFNGAVHKAVGPVFARHIGHKRIRAGSQHQFVVRDDLTVGGDDSLVPSLDGVDLAVQPQIEPGGFEEARLDQRQVFGGFACKKLG